MSAGGAAQQPGLSQWMRRGASPAARVDFIAGAGTQRTARPLVLGSAKQVTAGHYLAASAGERAFAAGGTAIDAGIAAGIALGVVMFDNVNYAGVAPIMLYHADSGRVVTIDGLGVWPRKASLDYFVERGDLFVPAGILRSVVPAAPDAWLTALARYGTLTLGEVLEPAWELAENGVPVSPRIGDRLSRFAGDLSELAPSTIAAFFPDGRPLRTGERLVRPELARVLKAQMDAEARARARGLNREEAIGAARDLFYRGWIGEAIAAFQAEQGGWLDARDLADFHVRVEPSVSTDYHGYEVHACGPWCQGPVLLQALNLLHGFDLERLGHNSLEYLHLLVEAMDLAFADRETFYADPRFVEVPMAGLLSKDYARERAAAIDPARASGEMRAPGNPWPFEPGATARPVRAPDHTRHLGAREEWPLRSRNVAERIRTPPADTSYVAAVDARGNAFSATPSDAVLDAPVIPRLGFSCSGRGSQSRTDPGHPSCIAPGKRPRLTPNPSLVMRDGRPLMALGCPGGDAQPQGMLQVILNMVHFAMNPQQAVEAPRVVTWNFPDSFAPHEYHPGRVDAENRIPRPVLESLAAMGHDVGVMAGEWSSGAAAVHVSMINPSNRTLIGAADPRADGMAAAW